MRERERERERERLTDDIVFICDGDVDIDETLSVKAMHHAFVHLSSLAGTHIDQHIYGRMFCFGCILRSQMG